MKSFFKKWRKENLDNIGKYLLYGLGEVLLIIIGILIAVNINERRATKKNDILRCQYMEELSFAIEHDIDDVKSNIDAYNIRNPKIKEILVALENNKLIEVDSISDKINAIGKYVFFVQQSKSKIDEMKFSNVNLILNRNLKNRILVYQESKIAFLKDQERRANIIDEDVRLYFSNSYGTVVIDKLESDKRFVSVTTQKYNFNKGQKENYEFLLKEQEEILQMIELELKEKCPK